MHPLKQEDHYPDFEIRKSWESFAPWLILVAVALVVFTMHANTQGWFAGKATLKGFVSDGYNKLYAFTAVNLIDESGRVAYTATVDRDGFFEVAGADPGVYVIQVNSVNGPYEETCTLYLGRSKTEEISIFLDEDFVAYEAQDDNGQNFLGGGGPQSETEDGAKKKTRGKNRSKLPFFKGQSR